MQRDAHVEQGVGKSRGCKEAALMEGSKRLRTGRPDVRWVKAEVAPPKVRPCPRGGRARAASSAARLRTRRASGGARGAREPGRQLSLHDALAFCSVGSSA